MQIQPYLFFDGRCEEAIGFYERALGAKDVKIMRFKDAPPGEAGQTPPGAGNKVMHANFRIGDSVVMASDGFNRGEPKFEGFSLSIEAPNDAETERIFAALSEGGQVKMPLAKTFFASKFGMTADRFGVSWMVITGV
jgi:PhnB protein